MIYLVQYMTMLVVSSMLLCPNENRTFCSYTVLVLQRSDIVYDEPFY
jgi:hypothetical protein